MLDLEQASDSRVVAGTQYSSQIWEALFFSHRAAKNCGKTHLIRLDIAELPLATSWRATGLYTRPLLCCRGLDIRAEAPDRNRSDSRIGRRRLRGKDSAVRHVEERHPQPSSAVRGPGILIRVRLRTFFPPCVGVLQDRDSHRRLAAQQLQQIRFEQLLAGLGNGRIAELSRLLAKRGYQRACSISL
jgi:hypothetical protein